MTVNVGLLVLIGSTVNFIVKKLMRVRGSVPRKYSDAFVLWAMITFALKVIFIILTWNLKMMIW